jgi:CRP-like cAMP-binding protein
VITIEPLRALAIRRDDLLDLLEQEPAMTLSMVRELARRLAEAT